MASNKVCSVCVAARDQGLVVTDEHSNTWWAETLDVSEASIRRHYKHGDENRIGAVDSTALTGTDTNVSEVVEESSEGSRSRSVVESAPLTLEDAREWIRSTGSDPDDYQITVRSSKDSDGVYTNKMSAVIRSTTASLSEPVWRPVEPARPVQVTVPEFAAPPLVGLWKTAVANADHQIGFRGDEPFHDDKAMAISSYIIGIEKPDQVIYCGDFLDLASQGKYEPEASFANTTQKSLDRGHEYLAIDRQMAPDADIILIEGNHDRRMEKFMATNAMAAHGLRRANYPESWPVMSIPNLLRLDELAVRYIDAYPAGMWWINDNLRAIHGDKVRSNGSTASAYSNALPHVSTIFGHTHRTEVQSKTSLASRGSKIKTMSINPGCMCRVDGEVPSMHGSTGVDGKAAKVWEDWQNGLAVIRYKDDGQFFVNLVQIEDGVTVYDGQELRA